jgi:hypothetical protein
MRGLRWGNKLYAFLLMKRANSKTYAHPKTATDLPGLHAAAASLALHLLKLKFWST